MSWELILMQMIEKAPEVIHAIKAIADQHRRENETSAQMQERHQAEYMAWQAARGNAP